MRVLFLTFFIVIADQITKLMIKGISIPALGIHFEGMPYQTSKKVIGDFFKITFIENPGMAFGLQIGGKLFLSIFTILATILLIVFLYKNRNENLLLRLALAFILGGAIGNLIDRVFYGKIFSYAPIFYGRVVDFIHIDFPNFTIFGKTIYSWPIFNIADISVTVGFLLILFGYKKAFPEVSEPELIAAEENNISLEYKEYFEGESGNFSKGNNSDIPERDEANTNSSLIDAEKNITEEENFSGNKTSVTDSSENNTESDPVKKSFHINSENPEAALVLQNFNAFLL
ncbi:MAG: signal peptidase II [Ignavibacteria bacterium]|nr:signal peptidase II [Ignavibacteria bacterium]